MADTNLDDADTILAQWKERGFRGGMWVDPPGRVWLDYVHDEDELFMVLDGEVELTIDGDSRHPPPGEEVFIPAGTRHTVRNTGSVTSRWLYSYRTAE